MNSPRSPATVEQPASGSLASAPDPFRLIVDALADRAVMALDMQGRVTHWSLGARQLMGHDAADIVGQSYGILFAADELYLQRPERLLQAAIEMGRVEDEGWRVRADGSRCHVHLLLVLLLDHDRSPVGFALSATPVSPASAADGDPEEDEVLERFRQASNAAGLGFWDYNLATNILRWDDQMFRLYGRSGSDCKATYSLWAKNLHPDDRVRCEQEVADAIAGTKPFDTAFRVIHPDESIHHLRATAKVKRDGTGRAIRMYGVNLDITEVIETRQRLEAMVTEHKALLGALHQHALVSVANRAGRIIEVNAAFCKRSGYSREELIGNDHRMVNSRTHPKEFWAEMWKTVTAGRSWRQEVCNRAKDGTQYWVDSMITPTKDPRTGAVSYISIRFDISESKSMALQMMTDASFDKLTGLANRSHFMANLERAIARVHEGTQRHYAVLFLDFDRFKLVNDTLGHDAGDELLRQIAGRLRTHLRASDLAQLSDGANIVSRFGGDEFLILVNDLASPRDAIRIAERLLNALLLPYDLMGSETHSTASIGIFTSESPAATAEDVVSNADVAMYEAKRTRRGSAIVFDEAMHTRLVRQVQVEASLRRALGTDELSVVYQPIVELATGRVCSAEALVRWTHPDLGIIAPSEFIPIAEECGLIVALDAWVLRQACAAMVSWQQGDPASAPDTISVNLSRAELAMGDRLLEQVQAALLATGLGARYLQLEVTEREVMRDPQTSLKLMRDLQALGVRLAMDDFGTGTSSLGVLRDFPFDTVKIDRAFVQGLGTSPELLAVIHATVNLVENLNMASLVEGIEEPAQVAMLQALGCRYGQGYLFGHGVPRDRFLHAKDRAQQEREVADMPGVG